MARLCTLRRQKKGGRELGEGCRVVVAEVKVSERGCYMWCQVEYMQLEGNDYS